MRTLLRILAALFRMYCSFWIFLPVIPVKREFQQSSLEEMKAWTSFSASDRVKVGRGLDWHLPSQTYSALPEKIELKPLESRVLIVRWWCGGALAG